MKNKLRSIAIHLPQFHPIPENDKWWGKGFTEWTNVVKAQPRFKGHYQPHLPADLGFYDLRLKESIAAQVDLAKEYGLSGFMFYHYWFTGKRILEKPVKTYLKNIDLDFPFMLCWANENWTRKWDGQNKDILLKQEYSHEDDINHFNELLPYFKDKRYIRVNGKPVYVIYRTELFPDIKKTTQIWRGLASKNGLEDLYLIRVESFKNDISPAEISFDASMDFQPNWRRLPKRILPNKLKRGLDKLLGKERPFWDDKIFSYEGLVEKALSTPSNKYLKYPCVTPMWDNSARRKKDAAIFNGSTPELYEDWLKMTVEKFITPSPEENFIFINAWNEWAEGNHLEPCQKWGRAYLEATKRALNA